MQYSEPNTSGNHSNQGDEESDTYIPMNLNEIFADDMKTNGIEVESLPIGKMDLEHEEYYNNDYGNNPRIVTNKGCIKVKNMFISIIQIIQMN